MQELISRAEKLYPAAALYLGSKERGKETLREAAAAAMRKAPAQPAEELLPQLFRICRTRAAEQPEADASDFPEALRPILSLPPAGRRSIACLLTDISAEDAAAALGISAGEQQQKTEKAMRQLSFLQGGDQNAMRFALRELQWTPEDEAALTESIRSSVSQQDAPAGTGNVREIVRTQSAAPAENPSQGRRVTVPLWVLIAGLLCIVTLLTYQAVTGLQRSRRPAAAPPETEVIRPENVTSLQTLREEFLTLGEAQEKAGELLTEQQISVFTSTKLRMNDIPPCYEVTCVCTDGQTYLCKIHAETGARLAVNAYPAEEIPDTADWIPAEDARSQAAAVSGLEEGLFLKEKLGHDSEGAYYKYELLGGDGRIYTVQINSRTGMLIKYTVEDPSVADSGNVIPPEEAQKQALARVADLPLSDAVFTKIKQTGNVYLIGFTLDDGTQYTIELDARTGMTNTVDVNRVSADTTDAIGILRARELALERAALTLHQVRFTKAKIDRSNAAYVYELEFETAEYEYEVTLNMKTGEILKYRALSQ